MVNTNQLTCERTTQKKNGKKANNKNKDEKREIEKKKIQHKKRRSEKKKFSPTPTQTGGNNSNLDITVHMLREFYSKNI